MELEGGNFLDYQNILNISRTYLTRGYAAVGKSVNI
jgi:hypothetical protein